VSGDNGSIFTLNIGLISESKFLKEEQLVKAGDNPHHMPLIQILVVNDSQFITVGYDRVIAHWEVLPGGIYLEHLGCLHTLGSIVTSMQAQN